VKEFLVPFIGQSYECKMCGKCCHCRTVPLSKGDMERVGRFNEDVDFMEYNVGLRSPVLARREWDYGCVFLDDKRCSIHQFKPLICRLFPYAIYFDPVGDGDECRFTLPDGKEVYIYIDTSCPGVGGGRDSVPPDWLLPLAQRIRLEMALTRFYYDGLTIQ